MSSPAPRCILAPEILDIVCVRGRLPWSIMSQGRSPHSDVNQTSAGGFSPSCLPFLFVTFHLTFQPPVCATPFVHLSSSLSFPLFQFQSLQSTQTVHYTGSLHLVAKPVFFPLSRSAKLSLCPHARAFSSHHPFNTSLGGGDSSTQLSGRHPIVEHISSHYHKLLSH